jgi:hypothetical protein
MTPQEAFKLGFLARCVEGGLSDEQTNALAKRAADLVGEQEKSAEGIADAVGKTIGGVMEAGGKAVYPLAALALATPPALGGLAAYFKNQATDIDEDDVESVKKQELIAQYKRMADQLRRQKQLRDYKQERQRTGQVFL